MAVNRASTALRSAVLFPLHERIKGHDSVAIRRRLEKSQWASPQAIADEQSSRLNAFVRGIAEQVPYYRDLFARSRVRPDEIRLAADLVRLPLLDKPLVRAHLDALKADSHGPIDRYTTGGSTGEPLIFYIGKDRRSHDVAAKWRATRWWGVDIGDPELVVWGSPVELGAQDRVRQLRDAVMRSWLLPAFEMSPDNLDRYIARIRQVRPVMLFGYPSSLSLIARRAEERGVRLDDLGIRVVFVTSEKLYANQRTAIARAFGAPVANGYGARDAGFIAHECPAGRLHLSAEDIVVETVRPDGRPCAAGESGEIVVTHTATRDFPLLRYRTGDVGVLADPRDGCACGRHLPVLAEVQGRSTDFIVAADGTVMHGLALIYTLRDLPGVAKFRIEQLSMDRTEVKVVTSPGWSDAHVDRIVRDFRKRLGESVTVSVDLVDEIPPERSGKYRYVVSRVDHATVRAPG